jgi:hypothetical protein
VQKEKEGRSDHLLFLALSPFYQR